MNISELILSLTEIQNSVGDAETVISTRQDYYFNTIKGVHGIVRDGQQPIIVIEIDKGKPCL